MRLLSVSIGLPRDTVWHKHLVTSAIFKEPVQGPVALRRLNLDGDRQADLSVHGGEYKAVYCYAVEHYAYWKKQLGRDLPHGSFGENFTTEGLLEDSVRIGDRYAVGSAEVIVTQPRMPCYKLGIKFEDDHMVKRFLASGRTGFYLAAAREGTVAAGDEITRISREEDALSVADITRLYVAKEYSDEDLVLLQKALGATALPESWKTYFRNRAEISAGEGV